MASNVDALEALGKAVRKYSPDLSFTMLEVGALPLDGGAEEPFYALLDIFPQSRIIAFEVDEELCRELNANARSHVEYFPVALGRSTERRTFYETQHPMCCSLYKPNEEVLSQYNNLQVAMLKAVGNVDTVDLDGFVAQNDHRCG